MRRSALVPSCFALRIAKTLLVLAGLVALSGCWVTSVNPLYEDKFVSKPDPDLIFDQNLVGTWGFDDEDCPGTLKIEAEEGAYDLTMTPSPQCKRDEKILKYEGHLVKLDSHVFLDLAPQQEEVCVMCLPLRQFFLVKIERNSLALTPIDYDWLKKSIEQKTVIIQTVPDRPEIVLTASSKELKDFVRKYADDKSAFRSVPSDTFKRK
jgi:hypothetical protein